VPRASVGGRVGRAEIVRRKSGFEGRGLGSLGSVQGWRSGVARVCSTLECSRVEVVGGRGCFEGEGGRSPEMSARDRDVGSEKVGARQDRQVE